MITSTLTKIFGTSNERVIKRMMPMVEQTGSFEPAMQALSDDELRAKTLEFRARIAARLEGIDDAEERVAEEKRCSTRFCPRPSPSCAKPAGGC